MSENTKTTFGDVLREASLAKGLSQQQLALHTDVSQAMVSLIGKHRRNLTPTLADGLARVLGGNQELWLSIYSETKKGTEKTVAQLISDLGGGFRAGQTLGTIGRRLLGDEILELFWFSKRDEECCIDGFDPRRVNPSSYDTRIGYVGKSGKRLDGSTKLEPGQSKKLKTLESFHFPLWLEAEVHPTTDIGLRGLTVVHGPIIDPGYSDGQLAVRVLNETRETISFDAELRFLKLRFTIFEREAFSREDLRLRLNQSDRDRPATDADIDEHVKLSVLQGDW